MRPVVTLSLLLAACLRCCDALAAITTTTASSATSMEPKPIDARTTVSAGSFKQTADGEWTSVMQTAAFPYDELIYSWNIRLPDREGFRIYLKAGFGPSEETPWLYAGFWGALKEQVAGREKPVFEQGEMDMDWLKLKRKADRFQFRVTSESTAPLSVLPALTVITTDNHPSAELASTLREGQSSAPVSARVLDLPFRRQMDSTGTITPSRCQSAALATALQYFGKSLPLEDIITRIYDPEYEYPGLWPRVIGAAGDFGFDGYIERFRDWDAVRAALASHKVILCSIRMAKGDCNNPPYEKMGNHIVALNGVTDDGRVVVTDSFLAKSGRGYRCQWLVEDFEKIWMRTKNGVAMVICPPKDTKERFVTDLPAFPADREPITGDDH